jgi:hypothetical protein
MSDASRWPRRRGSLTPAVIVTATIDGRAVRAEVRGPHGVRGDGQLVTVAAGLTRRGATVHTGPVLGGGPAGFDDDRIATAPWPRCSTRPPAGTKRFSRTPRRAWRSELAGGRAQAER